MAAITAVSDLKPFKTMWKIRVKIIRLWKQYSASGGLTIEMVLIDSNGVKINTSVKKDLVNQFDSFLSQGSSKILINFSLNPSCGSYRTTINPYKIGFLSTTRVRSCDDLPDALTGFEPVNYMDILDDVIGQIVELTPIEVVSANGKETHKLTVELRNEKYTHIQCVAYGALAHRLNAFWRSNTADVVVCVLRLWRIEWGEGGFNYVTNMEGGSDILFDSDIPEIQFFKSQIPSIDL
ncbi:uncharacterized protein LOC106447986 [Brassica napus]|uniref:uncharacterized protein LOC106447986 n=1 Tax=Brassica napus TaxID=3708 RepID=UPI0006AAB768|nr:uncharacterized protein LOC106447986 [Brassica napus]